MPPPTPQDELSRPLNAILGTEANVRLLRALALSGASVAGGELAKRAELGRTSIYPALRDLERSGIVEFVGAGSQRQIRMRDRHPLAGALLELFQAEARRFDDVMTALRQVSGGSPVRPISAWGRLTAPRIEHVDSLTLYFVARPDELEALTEYFNGQLAPVERRFDLSIVVKGLTRSELEELYRTDPRGVDEAILLDGVPPAALAGPRSRPSASPLTAHTEHDARSRRLALAVAEKIKRDPGLIAVAEERLKRRAEKAGPRERRELGEWTRVLSTMPAARLRRFLVEDSERAVRLRQSLPALGLLSPTERRAVIQSRTDADVIAAVSRR